MYIRLLNFNSSPAKKNEILKIADKFIPMIKARQGCQSVKFVMDDEGYYGFVVHWDSIEHADASRQFISPQLIPELEKYAKGEITIRLYEVYEPKG